MGGGWLEQICRVTVLVSLSIMGQDLHLPWSRFLWDGAELDPLAGATAVVGTGMLGFEPGEHLQHLMPTQMPAGMTGGMLAAPLPPRPGSLRHSRGAC